MRRLDRTAVDEPDSLRLPSAAVAREIADVAKYYKSFDPQAEGAKSFTFEEYKPYDVKEALRSLSDNKCAYCETDLADNLEVEHFRPKGKVEGEPTHSGYWWLAHSWTNLLPGCVPCNQNRLQHLVTDGMTVEELRALMAKPPRKSYGKANQFPIGGPRAFSDESDVDGEDPQFIDPARMDPEPHLEWSRSGDHSVVVAKELANGPSPYATATILGFALNRSRLVQLRTRMLTELRFQRVQMLEGLIRDQADPVTSAASLDHALQRAGTLRRLHAANQPYSAMVKAFVDDLIDEIRRLAVVPGGPGGGPVEAGA